MYLFKWLSKFGTLSYRIFYKCDEGLLRVYKDETSWAGDYVYIVTKTEHLNPKLENIKIKDGVLSFDKYKFTNIVKLSKHEYDKEEKLLEAQEIQRRIEKKEKEEEQWKIRLVDDISTVLSFDPNKTITTKASVYTDLLKKTFNTLKRKDYKKDSDGHYKIGKVYFDSSTFEIVDMNPNDECIEKSMREYLNMLIEYNTNVLDEHILKIKEILDGATKVS